MLLGVSFLFLILQAVFVHSFRIQESKDIGEIKGGWSSKNCRNRFKIDQKDPPILQVDHVTEEDLRIVIKNWPDLVPHSDGPPGNRSGSDDEDPRSDPANSPENETGYTSTLECIYRDIDYDSFKVGEEILDYSVVNASAGHKRGMFLDLNCTITHDSETAKNPLLAVLLNMENGFMLNVKDMLRAQDQKKRDPCSLYFEFEFSPKNWQLESGKIQPLSDDKWYKGFVSEEFMIKNAEHNIGSYYYGKIDFSLSKGCGTMNDRKVDLMNCLFSYVPNYPSDVIIVEYCRCSDIETTSMNFMVSFFGNGDVYFSSLEGKEFIWVNFARTFVVLGVFELIWAMTLF